MNGTLKFANSMTRGKTHRLVSGAAILAAVLAGLAEPATAAGAEVNLYSYRQEFLIRPMLDKFTEETGITVNVQYVKGGILKRMQEEGKAGIADLVLTADIATLSQHVEADTFQPVTSPVLEANIPAQYRDPEGMWFGLTNRARVIVYSKERVKPAADRDLRRSGGSQMGGADLHPFLRPCLYEVASGLDHRRQG